jgi:hypothetical protein
MRAWLAVGTASGGAVVMMSRRYVQWFVPASLGLFVGMLVASITPKLPSIASMAAFLFGIAVLEVAIIVKARTGYHWPWEGETEWAQARSTKAYLRNFVLWLVVVLLLLALFTLWQFPGLKLPGIHVLNSA